MDVVKWIEIIFGAAGALALFWSGFRGNLSNDTIKLMKENKQAQDSAMQILRDELSDHEKQAKLRDEKVAHLTGQIQMLKDVPLAQIAKSLEVVTLSHQAIEKLLNTRDSVANDIATKTVQGVVQFLTEKDKQNGNTN